MDKPKRTARLTHDGRLLWIIQGKKLDVYVIDKLEPEGDTTQALRLTKADKTQYTVSVGPFGVTCCCADANYRNRLCKHCLALKAVGILSRSLHGYHDEGDTDETSGD